MPLGRYFELLCDERGREVLAVHLEGIALLRLALVNKGTAFSPEERRELKLEGLLPPQVNTLEQQVERAYRGYRAAPTALDRYQYLRALQERQEILFYALLERHLAEMLPIVYTPTVGEAVRQFSALYQYPRGLSISPLDVGRASELVANYPLEDVRMIVATDSSAILGIGDQGYGGLAIPIGKLALYTAGGGVPPFHTLPVSLDVGTDRADLIDDPFYLGVRQPRLRGDAYLAFMDQFVAAVKGRWPTAVIQWEDLAKESAFTVLERYRRVVPSFNDDIQGTGAVALAGVLAACRNKGERLRDQRIVVHGAGAGGIGVAWALREGLVRDGLGPEEAAARVWVLDSRGLITADRKMEAYKRPFAQPAQSPAGLAEAIERSRATVLLGLSGQAGAFDAPVAAAMARQTERPVIFPLSNPTLLCEATPADLWAWTGGRALVATGSPFPGVAQGNNAFIFPGLGRGAMLSGAREITDGMVLEAAYALADYTAERHAADGRIYPPVDELPEVSIAVAARVMRRAVEDGVATRPALAGRDLEALARATFWKPRYLPVVRADRLEDATAATAPDTPAAAAGRTERRAAM